MTAHHPPAGTRVRGVNRYSLPRIDDPRGSLSYAEMGPHLPFAPRRYFVLFDVPESGTRGEHAHRELHQFLVCVHGTCTVTVDDGRQTESITLREPNEALHIEPLVWTTVRHHSRDTTVLVLASDLYREDDYVRRRDEFLDLVR